jgi:hypothetical protein
MLSKFRLLGRIVECSPKLEAFPVSLKPLFQRKSYLRGFADLCLVGVNSH